MTKNHTKNFKKKFVYGIKMVALTKNQEEMPDFVEKNDIHDMGLINSLLHLKIILKKMEEISVVKDLEINKLKELET